jgi:hypothetical protein
MKLVLLAKVVAEEAAAGQGVAVDAGVTAAVVVVAEAEAAVVAVAEEAAGVTAEIVGIAVVEAGTGAGNFSSWEPGFDGRRGAAAAPRFSFGATVAAGCSCGPHHEEPAFQEAGCNNRQSL